MVKGVDDPEALAGLARGRLKNKQQELESALLGMVGPHQRMMLQSYLRHLDFLDQEIATLDEEIERRMRPFEEELGRLDEIPGVGMGTHASRGDSHGYPEEGGAAVAGGDRD